MSTNREHGFTLLELLIVIVVIGILAAIVLAILNDANAKGRDTERVSDIRQINNALELYYSDHRAYPSRIYGDNSPLVIGDYINEVPTDPKGGPYLYNAIGDCNNFHVAAELEKYNSVLDSDADITDDYSVCIDGAGKKPISSSGPIDGTDDNLIYDLSR